MSNLTVNVALLVPHERLNDLLVTAFEGGITYWCESIERSKDTPESKALPYHSDALIAGARLKLTVFDDEDTYFLDLLDCADGLTIMATKYPKHFSDFLAENEDATTGDVFVQCCIFGELIYG